MAEINITNENIELILNKDEFRKLGSALHFAEIRLNEIKGSVKNDEKREDLSIFCRSLSEGIEAHLPFSDELKDTQNYFSKLIIDTAIKDIEKGGRLRGVIEAIKS